MGIFNETLISVECIVSELHGATPLRFLLSAAGYRADDEASLYPLAGFALFSCIQFPQMELDEEEAANEPRNSLEFTYKTCIVEAAERW